MDFYTYGLPEKFLIMSGLINKADYKNLITNIIRENNIKVIYTISVESWNIYNYVNSSCFQEKKITKILISYELKDCESLMVRTL